MLKITTRSFVLMCTLALLAGISFGQANSFPKPREERLLNDLKLLIWKQSGADHVKVSLRVHSGAAFDPVGKEGTAKLLSEIMFPDNGIFEDFADDLGGSLEITSTLDYMQIEMSATPDKLISVLEILAGAITNPQIDKESSKEVIEKRIRKVADELKNPANVADAEVVERLYGSFPYGRSPDGTLESLEVIDFADMIFAKQRFLTSDNSTLVISGDVQPSFAYRAARRLLGGWQKGPGRVEPNFTLPEAPETAPLLVNTDYGIEAEKRYGVEAASRKDANHFAAKLLAFVLDSRLKEKNHGGLTYNYFFLRGYYVLSQTHSLNSELPPPALSTGSKTKSTNKLSTLLAKPVSMAEFENAKSYELSQFKSKSVVEHWFDVDTYGLKSVDDEFKKLQSVTLENVTGFAKKIMDNPIVDVDVMPLDTPSQINDGDPDDPK